MEHFTTILHEHGYWTPALETAYAKAQQRPAPPLPDGGKTTYKSRVLDVLAAESRWWTIRELADAFHARVDLVRDAVYDLGKRKAVIVKRTRIASIRHQGPGGIVLLVKLRASRGHGAGWE